MLILDENLPARWTDYLASFGVEALHWTQIGNVGDPDEKIFDHASAHGAVIVTQDLDFTRILALRGTHLPSIIQLRVSCPTPEHAGPALVQILQSYRQPLLEGCLISLDSNRHRIRLLPLR